MIDRILELAERPARLNRRGELLVIIHEEGDEGNVPCEITIPMEEIAVVVLAHPQITVTQGTLSGLAKAGSAVVVCDEKFMPTAMLLPLEAHFVQGERFERQAQATLPTRKRIWQEIVRAKIKAQSNLLVRLHGIDAGLTAMAKRVRSGDPDNVEAQAAQRYWLAIFRDKTFRRDRQREDQNRLLNYGYTVLRAATARAICAAGLHPSLGVHHHNRYDAFRLADDLMEPFRPIVDEAVYHLVEQTGMKTPLNRDTKAILINAILKRIDMGGEERTIFDILTRLASSVNGIFAGERTTLVLPEQ